MAISTALLRDLIRLSSLTQLDEGELGSVLAHLVTALRATAPSYRGLQVTVTDGGHPITLTAFLPGDDPTVATSLRIPFRVIAPSLHPDSRIVIYAANPGALVDLAADLGYALRTRFAVDGVAQDIEAKALDGAASDQLTLLLDVDVPPPTTVSGVTGLDEASVVNRAAGVLIDRGHHPDEVHAVLRRAAADEGVEPSVYAARLLDR